jgi:hypothetical protein
MHEHSHLSVDRNSSPRR